MVCILRDAHSRPLARCTAANMALFDVLGDAFPLGSQAKPLVARNRGQFHGRRTACHTSNGTTRPLPRYVSLACSIILATPPIGIFFPLFLASLACEKCGRGRILYIKTVAGGIQRTSSLQCISVLIPFGRHGWPRRSTRHATVFVPALPC